MKQLVLIFYFFLGFFSFCTFAANNKPRAVVVKSPVVQNSNQRRMWTKDEDKRLKDAVSQHGRKNWKIIAQIVGNRNSTQCRKRWSVYLNTPPLRKASVLSVKAKTSWTPDEDKLLQDAVQLFGPKRWNDIALKVQTRNSKQCQGRWAVYLDPRLKHGNWTDKEDLHIVVQFLKHGSQWAKIAEGLEGRSAQSIKNRWHRKRNKSEAVIFLQNEAPPKKRARKQGPQRRIATAVAVPSPSISSATVSPILEENSLSGPDLSDEELAAMARRLLADDDAPSPTL